MFAGIRLRRGRSSARLIFPKWLVNPMRNDQDRHFFSFMLFFSPTYYSYIYISVKLCFRETLQYVSLSLRIYIHRTWWWMVSTPPLLLLLLSVYVYIKLKKEKNNRICLLVKLNEIFYSDNMFCIFDDKEKRLFYKKKISR